MREQITEAEIIQQVLDHMHKMGITPQNKYRLIANGELHRFSAEGDKHENCSYVIYSDMPPSWYFQDWKRGIQAKGTFDFDALDDEERKEYRAKLNDPYYQETCRNKERKREAKRKADAIEATRRAKEEYDNAPPATPEQGYFKRKGVKDIKDFRLGANGEALIPLYNASTGNFQTLQRLYPAPLPEIDTDKLFFKGAPMIEACYTFSPDKNINERMHFICEGIATGQTVFELTGRRYRVTCAINAGNMLKAAQGLNKRFPHCEAFIIAADNDLKTEARGLGNTGRRDAQEVAGKGLAKGIVIPQFRPDEDGSDWNDYAVLHGYEQAAGEFKRQLSALLAQNDTVQPQAKKGGVSEPESKIDARKNEEAVAQAVINAHNLLYHPSTGFFEYQEASGIWTARKDEQIHKYILDVSFNAKGTIIRSVMVLIRALAFSTKPIDTFNKLPVIGLKNETLHLDTREFTLPSPEDYVTARLSFPRSDNAKGEKVMKFLDDITAGDKGRLNVLQQAVGYVFFPDCRLQKAICFIGSGANGKSVLLSVMQAVFGSHNTSSVELSQLGKDFRLMPLKDSWLNISTEMNINLKDALMNFKKIVTGDTVNDSYKHKAPIDFRCRAKLFSACNELPKSSDKTEGFFRRWLFIDFPVHFVDSPTQGTNERKADRNIERAITEDDDEKAAFFNWALEGYYILQNLQRFTEHTDQTERGAEFKAINNPVIAFTEEIRDTVLFSNGEGQEVTRQYIYEAYKKWAEANSFKVRTSQDFHKDFRLALNTLGIPYKESRQRGKARCYDFCVISYSKDLYS